MQPSIIARVRQRFVAGVDDGAVVLHPLEEVILDVVRALADLERNWFLHGRNFATQPNRADGPNPPRPRVKHT